MLKPSFRASYKKIQKRTPAPFKPIPTPMDTNNSNQTKRQVLHFMSRNLFKNFDRYAQSCQKVFFYWFFSKICIFDHP